MAPAPLVSVSLLWGFPALFGPALAALVVAALADGRAGVKDLLGRVVRWRVGAGWYAVALGLPAVLALAAAGCTSSSARAHPWSLGAVGSQPRGFRPHRRRAARLRAPKLLAGRSALSASLILGVHWGAWHLPTFFVPGAPQHGLPFSAFVMLTVDYSVVFTWVYLHTRGGVLIASLMHGATNLHQGLLLGGINPARESWLLAAVYGVAAARTELYRKPGVPAEAPIGSGPRGKETTGRL